MHKEAVLTEWTTSSRKARNRDLDVRACAIGVRVDGYGTADSSVVLVRQHGDVLGANRVPLDDRSIAGKGERDGNEAQSQGEGAHGRWSKRCRWTSEDV